MTIKVITMSCNRAHRRSDNQGRIQGGGRMRADASLYRRLYECSRPTGFPHMQDMCKIANKIDCQI